MRTAAISGWVRLGGVVIAVPQLIVGGWALASPRGWYDNFPGFGPMLVAAEPPFNAHLATDAAGGFLATGLMVVLAAYWGERRPFQLAVGGLFVFAIAHLSYHATHPSDLLTRGENLFSTFSLVIAAFIPAALLWAATIPSKGKSHENAQADLDPHSSLR